jgi:F-type H+-transporting ATPase subunit delta
LLFKRFEILETVAVEYSKLFDIMNGVSSSGYYSYRHGCSEEAKIAKLSDKKITIENHVDIYYWGLF